MTLHVAALPHTQVTREYAACAYTQKVRRFIPMMEREGFDVQLHQHITRDEQRLLGFNGPEDYLKISFDGTLPIWQESNRRTIEAINASKAKGDVVCLIGGEPQQAIVDAVDLPCVEFGIGYIGTCQDTFKVFESHAWRHYVYGTQRADINFFDEVIPNYYELQDFPVVEETGDYYAFVGRMIDKKGYRVAEDVCRQLGAELVLVGLGDTPTYGDYRGMLGIEETIKVMAHAKALFVPTTYVAPFEGVHVEAQLCGTPVITSDQGVFTETVTNGVNGFRCRMFADFVKAAEKAPRLDRQHIAASARLRWSTRTVGRQFAEYFSRLATLTGAGWYA